MIVIWTEGGQEIGLGHVRRCLVIARELRRQKKDVLFLINDDPSAAAWISKTGFDSMTAALSEAEIKNIGQNDTVLIDTKRNVGPLIKRLRTLGCKTVLMDNTSLARLSADIVIYPTVIFENNLDWESFSGKVFYGADYVPIAESFIEMSKRTEHRRLQPPYQVLVTMGGSDPNHLTHKVISSLLEFSIPVNIKVVIGPAFSRDNRLDQIEKQNYPNIEFIRNREDLSTLMAESHIAITALGTTIFELAYMGVPSIIVANYREDENDIKAIERLGIGLPQGYYEDVSDADIRKSLITLLKNGKLRSDMSQKGRMIIDGKGAERIAAVVGKLLLENS